MAQHKKWEFPGALMEFAAAGEFHQVREIIDVFLSGSQGKVEFLAKAVLVADFAGAQRIAHSLKGAAKQLEVLRKSMGRLFLY